MLSFHTQHNVGYRTFALLLLLALQTNTFAAYGVNPIDGVRIYEAVNSGTTTGDWILPKGQKPFIVKSGSGSTKSTSGSTSNTNKGVKKTSLVVTPNNGISQTENTQVQMLSDTNVRSDVSGGIDGGTSGVSDGSWIMPSGNIQK
jgi:hypothetical protein